METTEKSFASASALLTWMNERHDFVLSAPVDVDLIASKLEISVEYDEALERQEVVGQILFREGSPVVKINPFQNSYEPRRRFTLAHELGHFCLHSSSSRTGFTDSKRTMSRSESYWDRYESEANTFAAQLLMPRSLVISEGQKIIDAYKKNRKVNGIPRAIFVEKLADKLLVSSKAMEYRLKNLGVIKTPASAAA